METEDNPLLVCDEDCCSKVFHESCVEGNGHDGFLDTDCGKKWICPFCYDHAEFVDELASAGPRIVGNPPHKRAAAGAGKPVGEPTAGAKRAQYATHPTPAARYTR